MRTPKERLMHLLNLAAEGESARPQLVQELSEILIEWPREYAPAARVPFEALLDKTIREADAHTRQAVADAVARRSDAPLGLLNQLFFAASEETKAHIIARNDGAPERASGPGRCCLTARLGFQPDSVSRLPAVADTVGVASSEARGRRAPIGGDAHDDQTAPDHRHLRPSAPDPGGDARVETPAGEVQGLARSRGAASPGPVR